MPGPYRTGYAQRATANSANPGASVGWLMASINGTVPIPNAIAEQAFEVTAGVAVTVTWGGTLAAAEYAAAPANECLWTLKVFYETSQALLTNDTLQVTGVAATNWGCNRTKTFTPSVTGTVRLFVQANVFATATGQGVPIALINTDRGQFGSTAETVPAGVQDFGNGAVYGLVRIGTTLVSFAQSAGPYTYTLPITNVVNTLTTGFAPQAAFNTYTVSWRDHLNVQFTSNSIPASITTVTSAPNIPIDKVFPAANEAITIVVTPISSPLSTANAGSGLPWIHFAPSTATTTPDSATTPHTATVVGTVLPTIVASPWAGFGNAMSFDGVNRGGGTQGVNAGNSVSGVPNVSGAGAAAVCCLEAKFQFTTVTAVAQIIAGRWAGNTTGDSFLLYITSTGKLEGAVRDSGGAFRTFTGATTLVAGTAYSGAMTYDGTNARLFVNGILDTTFAMSGLQAPDTSGLFYIGRDADTAASPAPYPFGGIIDEVRWSNVARYTANYTPATAPFTTDANTLGLWHLDSATPTTTPAVPTGPGTVTRTNDAAGNAVAVTFTGALTVDPRLTITDLMQSNSATFGTPPMVKNAGRGRITADLAFLSSRFVNSIGNGINGITHTITLADAGNLVAARVATGVVTATQGTEAGWGSTFLAWSDSLPGGTWNKTLNVTAPASMDDAHIVGRTSAYSLLAANPNFRIIVAAGPYLAEDDHVHPGSTLLVGCAVVDLSTFKLTSPDVSPAPSILVGRFNQTLNRPEYLKADGTWANAGAGAVLYNHALTVSTGDPQTFTTTFVTDTVNWTTADLFYVVLLYVNGTPYSAPASTPVLSSAANGHASFAFDPIGLALSGVLGAR